eukprot:TRINITY_DN19117_c0_g1_i1.p1 TRINITY_DN19117_c0_g1~~TRINITY_DN19117_c0_g1_i1.p1  ORF type:complete len:620 (+),score=138.95 TRINITY_DN19117_c0_g1_i1:91-1950(+)
MSPAPQVGQCGAVGPDHVTIELGAAPQDCSAVAPRIQVDQAQGGADFSILWRDLHVTAGGVKALRGVSGEARSGRLVALMGATGAGKSTLLNALAARGPEPVKGGVRYGKRQLRWSKALRRHVCFVEQDDMVHDNLEVGHALTAMGRLRLPQGADVEARVSSTLKMLRLEHTYDRRCGALSGGERKRFCIAQELLTDPWALLCDEPTTGFDSATAQVVADVLRGLSRATGVVIICAIHQPSSQLFNTFDDLYLLSDGRALYNGPVAEAAGYFEARARTARPHGYATADWMMELVVLERIPKDVRDVMEAENNRELGSEEQLGGEQLVEAASSRYAPYCTQLAVLARRQSVLTKAALWPPPWTLLSMHVIQGGVAGLLWLNTHRREEDIFPSLAAVLLMIAPWMFFSILNAVPVVGAQEVLLKRELRSGAFQVSAWFASFTTAVTLHECIWTFFYTPILFWMSGISGNFGGFVGLMLLTLLLVWMMHATGLIAGALVKSTASAFTLALLFVNFSFLFCGVLVPISRSPLPELRFANPLWYAFQLAIHIVMGDEEYQCSDPSQGKPTGFPDVCPGGVISPADVRRKYEVELDGGTCVGALFGITVLFRVLALLCVRRRMHV